MIEKLHQQMFTGAIGRLTVDVLYHDRARGFARVSGLRHEFTAFDQQRISPLAPDMGEMRLAATGWPK